MLNQTLNALAKRVEYPVFSRLIGQMLFLAALLLVLIAVIVPFSPRMPWEGLDPSWMYGMNEAVAQGMSFGKDIIFTFGPYASIYTSAYHPVTDQLMVWGALYWALSFVVAAYLNFRFADWSLKLGLLVALSSVMYSRDALFFFYPLLVGVQVYRWVAAVEPHREASYSDIALTIALFAPFGLLPLIKGSLFIACAGISVLSIALFAGRREWRRCLLIGAAPIVSLMVFWLISGHSLLGLVDYFSGLLPIISGYTEAMAINGNLIECVLYVMAAATLAIMLLWKLQGPAYANLMVVLIFSLILFLTFKTGFVRHDSHAVASGTMILLAGLLAGTLLKARDCLVFFLVCLAAWFYIDSVRRQTSTHSVKVNVYNTYTNAWNGLRQRLIDPDAIARNFEARVTEIAKRGAIPKLDGSVDIYSHDQSYLIASGNQWSPRPVFQSYAVYNARLAELNKAHLLSKRKPENIVFKLKPIDRRLPSLEDGASWPVLLSNYEPVNFENEYLFLKSRNSSGGTFDEPKRIGGGLYSLGENIALPETDEPLFMKVGIRTSFLGALANTIFKPSQLFVKLTMHNDLSHEYRIISGMAESGFVISPLVENTKDLGLLFSDVSILNDKKVKSVEIFASHFPMLWKNSIEVDFYELNVKSSPNFVEKMDLAIPHSGVEMKVETAQRCDGGIDFVNGLSPAPKSASATALLNVHGWLAASVDLKEVPDKVYLVLSNAEGGRHFIDAKRTQRLDVGAYFEKPELNLSGYSSMAYVSNLVGQYSLGLAYAKDDEILVCPQFSIPVTLNQE